MSHPTPSRRRPRRAPIGLAILIGALVAVSVPSAALAWTDYSFSSADEGEMITLINQARASAGLPALSTNANLTGVARWRSKDMWDRNYFSHTIPSPPGGNVFDEIQRQGICYTVAGENIGYNNYPDDVATQTMFNGWMDSPAHRALILGSGFNRIGLGAFKGTGSTYPRHYWTAVFTHSCSSATSTPPPTPKPTPKPTKTPGPPNPTPQPTPKPTPKPTPTSPPTAGPATPTPPETTPEPTLEPLPEVTPEPVLTPEPGGSVLGDAVDPIWRDHTIDGTEGPPGSEPPHDGGIGAAGGSLQVLEPPSQFGLLDTIVGGVVASFLGG